MKIRLSSPLSGHLAVQLVAGMLAIGGHLANVASAAVTLQEPAVSDRAIQTTVDVTTQGSVFTAGVKDKSQKHAIDARARFQFRERRLPSGGRDAAALRAVREFDVAELKTSISGEQTSQSLPGHHRQIVVTGSEAGVWVYSPTGRLSREAMDLLELPGEPLALLALLPSEVVDIGNKWSPNPWAVQMLATVEAVQKSDMTCELKSISGPTATISLTGHVLGQRYGANTDVKINGTFSFDTQVQLISSAQLTYTIKANIGTVSPGIDAVVESKVTRQPTTKQGGLTNSLLESIPISPPRGVELLTFDAALWNVQLLHDRRWHLFQAVLEGGNPVVIFRLVENGSLVCQCNVTQIPQAPAGQHASLDQFEDDIQKSLGQRLKKIRPREKIAAEDGQVIYRVIADGQTTLAGEKGAVEIPMQWNYYLLASPSGRQLSFVFAIEPDLVDQLQERDVEIVKSVRFVK